MTPSLRTSFALFSTALVSLVIVSCQSHVGGSAGEDPNAGEARRDSRELVGAVRLDAAEVDRLASEAESGVDVELAGGFELGFWGGGPLVADPTAVSIDDQGRLYYTRTNRTMSSEFDIRGHEDWMIESITFQNVEDRRSFLHRTFSPEQSEENEWLADLNEDGTHDWRDLAVQQEHVYRLEDTSGDGRADLAQQVFAGFDTEVSDAAGGLRVVGEDVFVGVAPDVWRLRDTTGDGLLDWQESISHGYGVHIGFAGHGVSGVTLGPDGRLYWAIGDVGLNVTDQEGREWAHPNEGAIMRSELDGSGFEVFARGLRNTHEFSFDEHGNLITVDNDGDFSGEMERLLYVVEGSDTGWRINWQFGKYTDPANNTYRIWLDEGLYLPRFEGQPAYILPQVAQYHTGPAGFAYNPGTALSEEWRNHFFVSEFSGSPASSRVRAFRLEESGAGFELAHDTVVLRGIQTTGIEVGPDGALYLADWVLGWGPNEEGRIWKLDTPGSADSALRAETRTLLAEGFEHRSEDELARLLTHADMRVRLRAQFALVDREATGTLLDAARQTEHRLARLHGLWGIGQLARQDIGHAEPLIGFLDDADAEVRAQAAKVIGDVRYAAAADALVPLLADDAARARFFASEALGRIAHEPAVQPIVDMLEANDDEDAYLRHAGSLALARIRDADALQDLADHPSRAVRIAAVVALRRMKHPGAARFLSDEDEFVVTEAARAINDDESIEAALPDLARVLDDDRFSNEALTRRAINANYRLGTSDAAGRLAEYAGRDGAPEAMRAEALAALSTLPQPSILDRVDGRHRGGAERDPAIARGALAPVFEALLDDDGDEIRAVAAEAAGRLGFVDAVPTLLDRIQSDPASDVRIAALTALDELNAPTMEEAVRAALADAEGSVRMIAISLIPTLDLPEDAAAEMVATGLTDRPIEEQQSAVLALGDLGTSAAEEALGDLLDQLDQLGRDELAAEIQLELMEAIEESGSPALAARLEDYQQGVTPFAEALYGGDARQGREIAFFSSSAECTRCHTFGDRGSDVGPALDEVGSRLTRDEILQKLLDPSSRVAFGYGAVSLTLENGEILAGTLEDESDSQLVVRTTNGARTVDKTDIAQRTNASAMPVMSELLTPRELRDVVEFLTTLTAASP